MSDSRLNYDSKKNKNLTNILQHLLNVQGRKEHLIRGWGNKIQGCGLKQIDFDSYKNNEYRMTTRIFRSKMDELLDKKFIQVFDKSTRTKRGPFYCITPLGLFYLLQKINRYPTYTVNSVFKLLSFHSNVNTKLTGYISKYFTEKQILKAMKILFYYSKIDFTNNHTIFAVDIPLPSLSAVRILQVRIGPNEINLERAKEVLSVKEIPSVIDENELNFITSGTIIDTLCFYLNDYAKNNNTKLYHTFKFLVGGVIEEIRMTLVEDEKWISKLG